MLTLLYTGQPREHKTLMGGQFQAREKELVIDIDMTDYADCRFCCTYFTPPLPFTTIPNPSLPSPYLPSSLHCIRPFYSLYCIPPRFLKYILARMP